MNTQRIKKLQKDYGFTAAQDGINSGTVWKMEGSAGRYASDLLKSGVCLLPTVRRVDYYGNVVPSRYDVKSGTMGSYHRAVKFWTKAWDMDDETLDYLNETALYI